MHSMNFNPAPWLHERLISLNGQYQNNSKQTKDIYCEEEARQHLLEHVINEETQYQQHQQRSRINSASSDLTPASPRFIAQFRLADLKIVSSDLLGKSCSICLEDLRLNQSFAQWPCIAKHTFHLHCMLGALRAGHKCPLCRYPVEAATLINMQDVIGFVLQRIMPNTVT